jgi:hypothetical protein
MRQLQKQRGDTADNLLRLCGNRVFHVNTSMWKMSLALYYVRAAGSFRRVAGWSVATIPRAHTLLSPCGVGSCEAFPPLAVSLGTESDMVNLSLYSIAQIIGLRNERLYQSLQSWLNCGRCTCFEGTEAGPSSPLTHTAILPIQCKELCSWVAVCSSMRR